MWHSKLQVSWHQKDYLGQTLEIHPLEVIMFLFKWNVWHFLLDRKWNLFIYHRTKLIKLDRYLDQDSMVRRLLESIQVRLLILVSFSITWHFRWKSVHQNLSSREFRIGWSTNWIDWRSFQGSCSNDTLWTSKCYETDWYFRWCQTEPRIGHALDGTWRFT